MAAEPLFEEFSIARALPVRTAILVKNSTKLQLLREGGRSRAVWNNFVSAFLPEGYPNSVTPDYLPFQAWDTLQGLSTYIRSMLSTQALLGGIGVGATTATVVGATFQWFLRDFTGMLGSILFTLHQGSNLDSSAKQWRLAADFMNDIGMLMDLVSPLFPGAFVAILCIGSMARSVTGVASGATRAALTQHFALRKNAADVSAKEGSQETAATMVGMLLGMILARLTSGNVLALWVSFLLLTAFHMYANYRAVRSLCLTSLNAERTSILLHAFVAGRKGRTGQEASIQISVRLFSQGIEWMISWLPTHKECAAFATVPTPREVADQEHLLPQLPSLPWLKQHRGDAWLPKCIRFGAQISSLKLAGGWDTFPVIVQRYQKVRYLVVPDGEIVHIVLHKLATAQDLVQAYVHALLLVFFLSRPSPDSNAAETAAISWVEKYYLSFLDLLGNSGWTTDRILVVTNEWRADWKHQEKQE